MIRRQVLVGLFVVQFLLLTLRLLAQGELNAPERPVFDEANGKWHWTIMTGEGTYGYVAQWQRRTKASSAWNSAWDEFVNVNTGDGRVNVERRVIIPADRRVSTATCTTIGSASNIKSIKAVTGWRMTAPGRHRI